MLLFLPTLKEDDISVYSIFCENVSRFPNNAVKIFTDGSKSTNNLSGAFYVPVKEYKYSFTLNPLLSIFSAEAAAILHAIEWAIAKEFRQVVICSDSQSVLKKTM